MNLSSPASSTFPAGFRALAGAALLQSAVAVPTTSYNTGSLGTAADGASTTGVVIDQPGAIPAFNDFSSSYGAGERTVVPFRSGLNPPAASPFTIEFWAKPTGSDNDDAPIGNRLGSGNRTGWAFFQRNAGTGWNFRMYNGVGSTVGWDLTGGTATLNAWSHVVAVWDGSAATLYVNGALASSTNPGPGGYVPNAIDETFNVGALFDGGSPFAGYLDEVAFYPAALTTTKIWDHFAAAASSLPGHYSSVVMADGPLLYLQQNPPAAKLTVTSLNPLVTTVTFTGILAQSPDLENWTDLTTATSPYTPPSPQPGALFFHSHR